jgi:hypothetical protein
VHVRWVEDHSGVESRTGAEHSDPAVSRRVPTIDPNLRPPAWSPLSVGAGDGGAVPAGNPARPCDVWRCA